MLALDRFGVSYLTEYVIPSMPGYRYDVFIPICNLLIEYDGRQHFEFTSFFHKSEEDFKHAQEIDTIKTTRALEGKYNLLRIDYTVSDISSISSHVFSTILDLGFNSPVPSLYLSAIPYYGSTAKHIISRYGNAIRIVQLPITNLDKQVKISKSSNSEVKNMGLQNINFDHKIVKPSQTLDKTNVSNKTMTDRRYGKGEMELLTVLYDHGIPLVVGPDKKIAFCGKRILLVYDRVIDKDIHIMVRPATVVATRSHIAYERSYAVMKWDICMEVMDHFKFIDWNSRISTSPIELWAFEDECIWLTVHACLMNIYEDNLISRRIGRQTIDKTNVDISAPKPNNKISTYESGDKKVVIYTKDIVEERYYWDFLIPESEINNFCNNERIDRLIFLRRENNEVLGILRLRQPILAVNVLSYLGIKNTHCTLIPSTQNPY